MENNIDKMRILGPFWEAAATVVKIETPLDGSKVLLLYESFEDYPLDTQPVGWRETRDNFSLEEAASPHFKTLLNAGSTTYGSDTPTNNAHTHFDNGYSSSWRNYVVSGTCSMGTSSNGVGITFLSQYKKGGTDAYYRLSNTKSNAEIALYKRTGGAEVRIGGTGVQMEVNKIYHFIIDVIDTGTLTEIRIKVWEHTAAEPTSHQLITTDNHSSRLTMGTVGIWTDGTGRKYVDNLKVMGVGQVQFTAFNRLFTDHPGLMDGFSQAVGLPGTVLAVCSIDQAQVSLYNNPSNVFTWTKVNGVQTPPDNSLEGIKKAIHEGKLCLLLLRALQETASEVPVYRCLQGYLNLDVLKPVDDAHTRLFNALVLKPELPGLRSGKENIPGNVHLHSSGLGLFGSTNLPWKGNSEFPAPFQLIKLFPTENQTTYRLELDVERFNGQETRAWVKAWQQLSAYVNPDYPQYPASVATINNPVKNPGWMTMVLSDIFRVPDIYWVYTLKSDNLSFEPRTLTVNRGALSVFLADQSLYNAVNPPRSIVEIIPSSIQIKLDGRGQLIIALEEGEKNASTETIEFSAAWDNIAQQWAESVDFQNLHLGYDAVDTPRFLRNIQNLDAPNWNPITKAGDPAQIGEAPLEMPVLWGMMPLETGWVQLPVINLSEQIYLDAGLEKPFNANLNKQGNAFKGAFMLSNIQATQTISSPAEQPWDVTILNASYFQGSYALSPSNGHFQLSAITLNFYEPQLICNGLFWLSNGKPGREDALPDLTNWIDGLVSVPIRSFLSDKMLFPLAMEFFVPTMRILPVTSTEADQPINAQLEHWETMYRPIADTINKLIEVNILPEDEMTRALPMLWLRDPYLPTVQALPMTQTQSPPNHPSASRQLAPFQFETPEAFPIRYIPENWVFRSNDSNAAAFWMFPEGTLQPAKVWSGVSDLPMAVLSLPGLLFDPNATLGADQTNSTQRLLNMQFRLDLPYLDEVFAMAQLPRNPQNTQDISPLPDSPPPQPPKPLQRADYGAYWSELSNLANLSSAAAVEAFAQNADDISVHNLIEPLQWPVSIDRSDLTGYPGNLNIRNQHDEQAVSLTGVSALKGISGFFERDAQGLLSLQDQDQTDGLALPLEVTAHSMAAWKDHSSGHFRDQRGLYRSASTVSAPTDGPVLLKTTIDWEVSPGNFITHHLNTTARAIEMHIPGGKAWNIWFKDVPLKKLSDTKEAFNRLANRSDSAADTDVNDPEALSSAHNFLQGYEWRLNHALDPVSTDAPLELLNLHFYPLTLDELHVENSFFSILALTGRLQLPLRTTAAQKDLNNVVRVVFERDNNGALTLNSITPLNDAVEWPLDVNNAHFGEVPRLVWNDLTLADAGNNALKMVLQNPALKFMLFQTEWFVQLSNLDLSNPVQSVLLTNHTGASSGVVPGKCSLQLDIHTPTSTSPGFNHTAYADINLVLHTGSRVVFDALIRFPLLNDQDEGMVTGAAFNPEAQASFIEGKLWESININAPAANEPGIVQYSDHAFQLAWSDLTEQDKYQFLPGIHLKPVTGVANPGFAALTFMSTPVPNGIPTLTLELAYLEELITASWGAFLQSANPTYNAQTVFDATAGALSIGYTFEYRKNATAGAENRVDSFLLNGYLEVKNLLSWPSNISFNPNSQLLDIPGIADADNPDFRHLRHSMRILLNQHKIPADILTEPVDSAENGILFTLSQDKSWQFLAVVEHQMIELDMPLALGELHDSDFIPRQYRWTAVQEVRWMSPRRYRQHLLFTLGKLNAVEPDAFAFAASMIDPDNPPAKINVYGRALNIFGTGVPNLQVDLYLVEQGVIKAFPSGAFKTFTDEEGRFKYEGLLTSPVFVAGRANQLAFRISKNNTVLVSPQDSPLWTHQTGETEIIFNVNLPIQPVNYLPAGAGKRLADALANVEQEILIVEASAAHLINLDAVTVSGYTNLQFLPTGLQTALLSTPADFSISDPQDPRWQLLRTPFIGRMQANLEKYHAVQDAPRHESVIHIDPLLLLYSYKKQGLAPIATDVLTLSSWSSGTQRQLKISQIDHPAINRWAFLDKLSLEASLLRFMSPSLQAERQTNILTSVMETYPGTAAGLSRAHALTQAVVATRSAYPPQPLKNDAALTYGRTGATIWREDSLLEFDMASLNDPDDEVQTVFAILGLQFAALFEAIQPQAVNNLPSRFVGVTLLPVPDQGEPMSFVVSPYLGVDLIPSGASTGLVLVSAELLCLEQNNGYLRPIAGKLFEINDTTGFTEDNYKSAVFEWASETQARISPKSPLSIVRFRNIEKGTGSAVNIRYAFNWLTPLRSKALSSRVFNLRTAVDNLRFREGQYGGNNIPPHALPDSSVRASGVHDPYYVELAPPQVSGVQPVYLTADNDKLKVSPWGLSGLLIHNRLTQNSEAIIGAMHTETPNAPATRLWWQGIQQFVQYRSENDGRPRAGLPRKFRAEAVKSLLPALTQMPLPVKAVLNTMKQESAPNPQGPASDMWAKWQPIMPGSVRTAILGARAGVPFVYRNQLMRQIISANDPTSPASDVLCSGSVPVQHRFPRPVALPPNSPDGQQDALQTWASPFRPDSLQYAQNNPVDEAFFAECGKLPESGLTLTLGYPAQGAVPSAWDGVLRFQTTSRPNKYRAEDWTLKVEMSDNNGKMISWVMEKAYQDNQHDEVMMLEYSLIDDFARATLLSLLSNTLSTNAVLTLQVHVQSTSDSSGYFQTLSFPLRVLPVNGSRLPLQPVFVHFEDPEYNRRLASASAHTTRTLLIGKTLHEVRLSADRKAYNPDSEIAYRIDWAPLPANIGMKSRFSIKDNDSGAVTLIADEIDVFNGDLMQFSLLRGLADNHNSITRVAANSALIIDVKLNVTHEGQTVEEIIQLALDIVLEPVVPPTHAAYALLRQQSVSGVPVVDCPRFAWGAAAFRIDMVCANDLTTEIVRRRAVFHWQDTTRPGREVRYAIQKISKNGATHFPDFSPE